MYICKGREEEVEEEEEEELGAVCHGHAGSPLGFHTICALKQTFKEKMDLFE